MGAFWFCLLKEAGATPRRDRLESLKIHYTPLWWPSQRVLSLQREIDKIHTDTHVQNALKRGEGAIGLQVLTSFKLELQELGLRQERERKDL